MKEKKFDSDQILRMAYARMSLDQLKDTQEQLQRQLLVLGALIAERSEEVTSE